MNVNKAWTSMFMRVLTLLILLSSATAWSMPDPCLGGKVSNASSKTTVLFVNGINNTLSEACNSSANLIKSMPEEARSRNYSYIWNVDSWKSTAELLYQERISSEAVVSARLQNGGAFDKNIYYKVLGEKYQSLAQGEYRSEIASVSALHFELEYLLFKGQSIVVVVHSQGNHIIEAAYSMLVYQASLDSSKLWKLDKIRVVGAASVAHTTPNGKYVSIAEDAALASFESMILIAGRNEGRPLERNYATCTGFTDFQCIRRLADADLTRHGFSEIYLNGRLIDTALNQSLQTIFVNLVLGAIRELEEQKAVGNGTLTVLANTIPGAVLTVPTGATTCTFKSSGTWSAGPNAPTQYQNADGVIGTTSYNLTNFGVPMPGEANMALVVKHSSTGTWDLLGSSKTIAVAAGETLSFMMNDATTFGYTDGNTGQLTTAWSCQ